MARGQSVNTGKWNFHVKRHTCPNCNKKGCYKSTRTNGFKAGRIECYDCMYCKKSFSPTEIINQVAH